MSCKTLCYYIRMCNRTVNQLIYYDVWQIVVFVKFKIITYTECNNCLHKYFHINLCSNAFEARRRGFEL